MPFVDKTMLERCESDVAASFQDNLRFDAWIMSNSTHRANTEIDKALDVDE
jgi:hypothetical protein